MIKDVKKPRWHKEKNANTEFERSLRISIHNHEIPWTYIVKRFVIEPRANHYYSDHWLVVKDTKTNKIIMEEGSTRAHARFDDSTKAYKYISEKRRDLWDPAIAPAPKKKKTKSSAKKGGSTCSSARSSKTSSPFMV